MPKNQEINGISVRDEIKLLLVSLWMGEADFETLTLHAGGFTTHHNGRAKFTHFKLKQTEQNFVINNFPKYSRYAWASSKSHHEGDKVHFGKTYHFVKLSESSTE
jgi:hypothetical protein